MVVKGLSVDRGGQFKSSHGLRAKVGHDDRRRQEGGTWILPRCPIQQWSSRVSVTAMPPKLSKGLNERIPNSTHAVALSGGEHVLARFLGVVHVVSHLCTVASGGGASQSCWRWSVGVTHRSPCVSQFVSEVHDMVLENVWYSERWWPISWVTVLFKVRPA